jgi:hypothetical protein
MQVAVDSYITSPAHPDSPDATSTVAHLDCSGLSGRPITLKSPWTAGLDIAPKDPDNAGIEPL